MMARRTSENATNADISNFLTLLANRSKGVTAESLYHAADNVRAHPVRITSSHNALAVRYVGRWTSERIGEFLRDPAFLRSDRMQPTSDSEKNTFGAGLIDTSKVLSSAGAAPDKYVPQYRSREYAVLVALFLATQRGMLNVDWWKLIEAATPFTDEYPELEQPFSACTGMSYATWSDQQLERWRSVRILICKGLVGLSTTPVRYGLTVLGLSVAREIMSANPVAVPQPQHQQQAAAAKLIFNVNHKKRGRSGVDAAPEKPLTKLPLSSSPAQPYQAGPMRSSSELAYARGMGLLLVAEGLPRTRVKAGIDALLQTDGALCTDANTFCASVRAFVAVPQPSVDLDDPVSDGRAAHVVAAARTVANAGQPAEQQGQKSVHFKPEQKQAVRVRREQNTSAVSPMCDAQAAAVSSPARKQRRVMPVVKLGRHGC